MAGCISAAACFPATSGQASTPVKAGGGGAPPTAAAPALATASGPGKLYTDNPNERTTKTTKIDPKDLVAAIHKKWPQLNETGVHTLAAQAMHETSFGNHCYKYNLGNRKQPNAELAHMYLHRTWEGLTPSAADEAVQEGNGSARIASSAEIAAHGWAVGPGKVVTVFDPPNREARFAAYDSLDDGTKSWVDFLKRRTAGKGNFVDDLNAGDTKQVTGVLHPIGYFTGDESAYAKGMASAKRRIDDLFGAEK